MLQASKEISLHCRQLASPNIANFVVSCFILLGIVVSYLPQHYRIISRRSSEGLSPYWVLLGTTSGTCAIANILTLPTSREDIGCCNVNDGFSCFAGLLGIAQIGVQWGSFFLIMFLFLIFVPRLSIEQRRSWIGFEPEMPLKKAEPHVYEAVVVVAIAIVHFIITLLVTVIILARFPGHLQTWANVLGVLASVLGGIQYLPQIYTTWKLKHVGSLSIPMMCIQTPGGFLFAGSLAVRLGREGWSAWSVYLMLGTLQGVLLSLCIYYELRNKRKERRRKSRQSSRIARQEASEPITPTGLDDEERSPLLRDGQTITARSESSSDEGSTGRAEEEVIDYGTVRAKRKVVK